MFTIRPDKRCLRGLHFVCAFDSDIDRLPDAIRSAYSGRLVEQDERRGSRVVLRMIFQFRFELQVDPLARTVDIIHRATAPAELRDLDRAALQTIFSEAT